MNDMKDKLNARFAPEDLLLSVDKSSIQADQSGELFGDCMVEISPTAIYERLDDVFGSDGWETSLEPFNSGDRLEGFRCSLKVRFTQEKVVERTGLALIDSRKGPEIRRQIALSNSLQSAAKQVGIGRYISGAFSVPVDADGSVLDLPDELMPEDSGGDENGVTMSQQDAFDEIPIGTSPPGAERVADEIGKPIPFRNFSSRKSAVN